VTPELIPLIRAAGSHREVGAQIGEATADAVRRAAAEHFDAALVEVDPEDFEQALKELEAIVDRLEKGDVELEASILIYERGEALKAHCDALLRKAEAKVEKISLNANNQPAGTEPLDVED